MPALFLYLLKANVALMLLFALYYFAFRKLTFHKLNRLYLLCIILFSAIYPFLDINLLPEKQQSLSGTLSGVVKYWPRVTMQAQNQGLDIWTSLSIVFFGGLLIMVGRLVVQFVSLYQLHKASFPDQHQQFTFRNVNTPINPFSFGRSIYLHPKQHTPQELQFILQHEQVHVDQFHTLDVLATECLLLFTWYNPFAWLLQKAVKENLEFITDNQVLQAGLNKKQYQYALLRALSPSSLSLVSPFHVVPLKNRISMMNKIPSKSAHLLKLLLVPPALATLLLFSNNNALGNTSLSAFTLNGSPATSNQSGEDDYKAFLQRNPTVKGLSWNNTQVYVHLKSGKKETYPSTPQGLAEVEKRYGSLPVPSPPPPPAPAAPAAPQVPPPPPPFRDAPKEFVKQNPTVQGLTNDGEHIYVLYKSEEVEKFPATAEGIATFKKKFKMLPPPPPPVQKSKN